MSDMGDTFRDWKEAKRKLREAHGIPCPECRRLQPRRDATILLPGQRCRVDKYRDPRPRISDEEFTKITGWGPVQRT